MGTWLVSEKIQKKTKRKQRLSLGLGATKLTDHTRARMVSRLAEIKAEGMCCMSTTADTLNHRGSSLPGTRVAAHGKRAAPLLARFLLTAQGAGVSGLFSQPRVRHGAFFHVILSNFTYPMEVKPHRVFSPWGKIPRQLENCIKKKTYFVSTYS